MESTYAAIGGAALAQKANKLDTPLDEIERLANRAEIVSRQISGFINRMRGDPSNDGAACTPVPMGYLGQITRLREAISDLETLSANLSDIG